MFKTRLVKQANGRYHGEVTWGEWQVFICPNEYDHEQDARNETNRQFAGALRTTMQSLYPHAA